MYILYSYYNTHLQIKMEYNYYNVHSVFNSNIERKTKLNWGNNTFKVFQKKNNTVVE